MAFETILTERDGTVLSVTLNRPDKLNAATDELLHELADAFKQAGRDEAVRAIILTGAGRGFCAGQDLASVQARVPDEKGSLGYGDHLRHSYNELIHRMRTIEKPIIVAVNGVAAGAGMSLVMASDLRLAAESAVFLQAFVKIGLVPDSGSTWFLPRLIGQARALEMMLTGRRISAQQAEAWGLINRVVPDGQLMSEARALAQEMAALPPKAVSYIKRAVNFAATSTLPEALDYEADMQELAGRTEDHKEGVEAFLAKRTPEYKGR
ncbi:MAG: enoyl-CoA hydratase-related protein [Ardenticatenaceae bacterium]|nr:enoyl-CoA hydratase-related protein [Ardenticatenaceae bacterium]